MTNEGSNDVTVINTGTNTVTATISVGDTPLGVAVSPDGTKVYVTNGGSNIVSVIDTATDKVITTVNVGLSPNGIVFTPDGKKAYVTNSNFKSTTVSVIDTATNTVISNVDVGVTPLELAVNHEGTKIYVTRWRNQTISVIDTATNTVMDFVNTESRLRGIAVTPDRTKLYVTSMDSSDVFAIDIATKTITASVPVGSNSAAAGQFIGLIPVPVLPVADFSSKVSENSPLYVQFKDLSKNATEWNWNFGDGQNSKEQNPTHTYPAAGNYKVTLKVSNSDGKNTKTSEINIQNVSKKTPSGFNSLIFVMIVLYFYNKSTRK